MNITVTEKACKFISRMIRFNGGNSSSGFRLRVSPGGCSGLNSDFTVEAEPHTGDAVLETHGIKLFLPAESRILLEGVTIDFADTALSTGLTFINPNAPSCGCGSSGSHAPSGIATVSLASIARRR